MAEQEELKIWFEQAVTDVLDDLYGAAMRLAKNAADAEDLVGESVAKAFKSIESLKDRATFRGWIFRIMSNCFMSECRKRKTRAETSLSNFDEEEGDDQDFRLFDKLHQPFLLWWGNPEQEFINNLLREDLIKAIDELPENFRIVLVLAEIEGFPYQEIADMLEVPIGTVRSRLSRARSMLQKTLWKYVNETDIQTTEQRDSIKQDLL